jgi:cell division protein FtsB
MIEFLIKENEKLTDTVNELKEEQKKLQEEIKMQNIVLNSLPIRVDILN